jgi:hypothetical protein
MIYHHGMFYIFSMENLTKTIKKYLASGGAFMVTQAWELLERIHYNRET